MSALEQALRQMAGKIMVLDTPEIVPLICSSCDGLGYIRYEVPISDVRFGKLYPCPDPNCPIMHQHRRQQILKVMETRSSWIDDDNAMTFASFRDLMGKPNSSNWKGKRGAYAMAMAFSRAYRPFTENEASQAAFKEDWPNAKPGVSQSVVFTGGVGIGKTGLAKAAMNDLSEQDKVGIFIRLPDLITHVQEGYRGNSDSYDGSETAETRIQIFANAPYLIIDEFETDDYTPDRKRIVEAIIRGRADRPNMPPFMITTNLTLDEMYSEKKWGKRIADVVAKAHWVPMGGLKLRQTRQTAELW